MVNRKALIHSEEYFKLEHIKARQEQYNFTQAIKVETFLWDLELYGQIQKHLGNKVTLKGGAAAQLFFPPEKQRTSVDIDVIYIGDIEELHTTLDAIHQSLGGDDTFFKFELHTPKNPKTILPMETYFVNVPSRTKPDGVLQIKVDFHFLDKLELDIVELESGSAFVLPLEFTPRCLSIGSLLGDKLLTFARGSVGIPEERQDDIMKQLYDVDLLSRIIPEREIKALQKALPNLFERELSVRPDKIEFSEALQQMVDLLEKYTLINHHTCEAEIRSGVANFKGNYEPRPYRTAIAWEITAKRLQFLVRAIQDNVEQCILLFKQAEAIEKMIGLNDNPDRGEIRTSVSKEFVEMYLAKQQPEVAKRIKSSAPERIFWEVVRPGNLDEIQQLIRAKIQQSISS